jgi:orotate phosphoribosyltransferase
MTGHATGMITPSEQLLSLLRTKAYRAGTFTLASGKQSDFYINCKDALLTAEGHVLAGSVISDWILIHFKLKTFQAVAGVALGGCPLASAVSLTSKTLDALYVRKEAKGHGTKSLVEGSGAVPVGANVLLLEDVVTSGGSSLKAVETLRDAGYKVKHVLTVVDREEGGQEALKAEGITLHSLYTRKDFLTNV